MSRRVPALLLAVALLTPAAAGGALPPPGVPASLRVEVTGSPAPVETLVGGLVAAARARLPGAQRARVALAAVWPPLSALPPASRVDAGATFELWGPDDAPPLGYALPVTITNVALPWTDAQALLVSNDPETVTGSGTLYRVAIAAAPVRLVYHHQNGDPRRPLRLAATLENPTAAPAVVWATVGSGGPSGDELGAGHDAARAFLVQYAHRARFRLDIPAGGRADLASYDLPPHAIASGVVQLTPVEGTDLDLVLTARRFGEPASVGVDVASAPEDRVHQRGVFGAPEVYRALSYAVDGPDAFMVLGDPGDALRPAGESGTPLRGNYGVVYTFDVRLENATSHPAAPALVLHAEGGPVRGTFLVDGAPVEVPPVLPNRPRVLATVDLPPHTRRALRIVTMPESGSSYPALLTLGPA